eukprot:10882492-Ditylum_brightwellii.AAC.2
MHHPVQPVFLPRPKGEHGGQKGLQDHQEGHTQDTRYWDAVTIVDHASNFSYSHLIKGASNVKTLSAMGAYERVMHSYGHKVDAYHWDNGRFYS